MKRILFPIITVCLCLVLVLICSEIILRSTGHTPWRYVGIDSNEPTMHEPDPVLGWRNKEGKYTVPPYVRSGETTYVTFLNHGRRTTGPKESDARDEFIIVGDSFTQGWAISDAETYPWKLQQSYPSLKVLNYGTGGYGTYQSLLVLERELPRMKSPALVVYGFFSQHEKRNVADDEWLRTLSRYSKRAHVFIPYATADDDGGLARHSPERFLALPLHERSATIAGIETLYMWMTAHRRGEQGRRVTETLLMEMNKLCEKYGAKFVTVILHADDETSSYYKSRLEKSHMEFIDCNYPLTEEMRVPGEGHPNGRMNSLWAQCIQRGLGNQIALYQSH